MKRLFCTLIIALSFTTVFAQDCPEVTSKKALKLYEQALDKYKSKATYRDLLKEAIDAEPEFAVAIDSLARSWFFANKANDYDGDSKKWSVKYFKQAVEVCPDVDPLAYYAMGRMDLWNSRYADATANLKKYLSYEKRTDKEFKLNDTYLDTAEILLKDAEFYATVFTNKVPFNPTPLPNVCTTNDEALAALTPDNEILYFTRRAEESSMNSITGPKLVERFCVAKIQPDGSFDKGRPMGIPFNRSGENQGGPSSTIDNKILYFTTCIPAGTANCDIYYSEFVNGEWTEPQALPNVNLPDYWDSQPSVSSDGNTIYFVSDRPGGQGDKPNADIYKTVKDANGNWSKPVNLGPVINTPSNENAPFFHTDGQTLYFSSEGHQNIGGFDIFFSKLDSTGKFQKPKNIGYPINTKEDDRGFFCSTDGKTAYLYSEGYNGPGKLDIIKFDLYAGARPEKVLFVKGQLKDDKNQPVKNASIEIKNVDTKEVVKVKVDSTSGNYVAAVAMKNDFILTVKQPGGAFTSQYFAKSDTLNTKPRKVDIEVKQLATGKGYTLNNINFATNSFELPKQSKPVIEEFARYLKDNSKIKVAINGHTDDVGNDNDNLTLSDNRAKAVYEYLISQGVSADRLSYKGYGETKPLVPNTSDANRAKNRRTEFVIVAK